ncbi:hypothetical protein PHLCEN_2v8185 [Hermanssonia centrifuga]|uniref:Uncharacterized protein n=1 Tax=Hermanssonia centrifuga TaxID=98765 RepID=A0A2R6NUD9_9APHY|nr:hypothetical protein PHLCEN_2v8185 [Hermanssonia centrifuga]
MGDAGDKELARANKIMGSKWIADVRDLHGILRQFLNRAIAAQQDYDDDELEAPEGGCPICGEKCIRELATSPIVHDGIFGQADEQTNLRIEKEFETAAAKGLRPCPTCKKMNDLKQTAVFLSSAFQPTSEDLKRATQRKYPAPKNRNFTGSNPGSSRDLPTREEIQAAMMEVSDSDDSLPDISTIIKNHKPSSNGKSKGKARTIEVDSASDDDLVDITVGDITSGLRKSNIRKTSGQGKYNQRDGAPASTVTPSQHLLATWRDGGENLEASVKMTALVRFLQEWESTGDKTIVFSQCQ